MMVLHKMSFLKVYQLPYTDMPYGLFYKLTQQTHLYSYSHSYVGNVRAAYWTDNSSVSVIIFKYHLIEVYHC